MNYLLIMAVVCVVTGIFNIIIAAEKLGWIASVCGWLVVIIQIWENK